MVDLRTKWLHLSTVGPKTIGVTPARNPLLKKPDWYDEQRFKNAQKLAKKYYLSLNIAHFIGNILLIHLPDVLIPVLATGHSASPYQVFMRILSTIVHILSWYEDDPFDPKSDTHKSLLTVRRRCHMAVSRMMNNKYPRDDRYWLSQFDMAMTQWSLIGIVAIRPNECGFHHCTKEEFEEYFYFWKVMGYCVGIEDRFNVCQDLYEDSVEFMQICYDECYAKHLTEQCEAVRMGMDLTEGVFIGLNTVIPRWIISYESFMPFWYNSLGVRHPIVIKNNDFSGKISTFLWDFLIDYLLRFRLLYHAITWFYLFMLKRLFTKKKFVAERLEITHPNTVYRLREDFHLRESFQIIDKDNNNNPDNDPQISDGEGQNSNHAVHEDKKAEHNIDNNSTVGSGGYYFVDNYFYKSNV